MNLLLFEFLFKRGGGNTRQAQEGSSQRMYSPIKGNGSVTIKTQEKKNTSSPKVRKHLKKFVKYPWDLLTFCKVPASLTHRTTFEKCATGRFLLCCYVKIYQLFLKLSGGIFQCSIAAIWGSVQVYMGARLMTHSILHPLAFIALMIHLPS